MLYNYIAIVFFAIIAIAVPYSMLLAAKLLRHKARQNTVKNAPYESAEATTGKNRDIINDYLPYFIMFLPFEIVAIILLLWSPISRQINYSGNLLVLGLAGISLVFTILGYLLIRDKNAGK